MTTNEEEQKDIEGQNEVEENPEEQKEEEEEPVDLELQKEMKGIKIDDSDFANDTKTKKSNKKIKNLVDKKQNKKGQDFLEYANKNNIEINIEYEENKYQLKKNQQKNDEKSGNKTNDNKRQYNKGGYNKNKNYMQKRMNKYTGNKFDGIVNQPPYGQKQKSYQSYASAPAPKLVENNEILEYLEKMFSEENLNKNTYIRNRLVDGKFLVDDVVNYHDIKKNNIDATKIIEVIKDSKNLEIINEENKNYVKIKNIDSMKLLKLEEIIANKSKKNNYKNKEFFPNMYQPYNYPLNNIYMQNNYYYYGNQPNFYPNPYMPFYDNNNNQ